MTITIHPANMEQDTLLRVLLDALHIDYKEEEGDETAYLNSSPAMVAHLNESIAQEKNGEVVGIDFKSLLPK